MKKIINSKLYDTSTAKLIDSDGGNFASFSSWREELYRKRTGEYFLYGEGGPASKYRRQVDVNTWSGSSDIIPLTYAEAVAWAEEHMVAEAYIEHFGPVAEDDSRTILSLSISQSAADAARKAATGAGISLSAYIERLIANA